MLPVDSYQSLAQMDGFKSFTFSRQLFLECCLRVHQLHDACSSCFERRDDTDAVIQKARDDDKESTLYQT